MSFFPLRDPSIALFRSVQSGHPHNYLLLQCFSWPDFLDRQKMARHAKVGPSAPEARSGADGANGPDFWPDWAIFGLATKSGQQSIAKSVT